MVNVPEVDPLMVTDAALTASLVSELRTAPETTCPCAKVSMGDSKRAKTAINANRFISNEF